MKELLSGLGIQHIEHNDITSDLIRQDAVRKLVGNKSFPMVFVDDRPIGVILVPTNLFTL